MSTAIVTFGSVEDSIAICQIIQQVVSALNEVRGATAE
jgi:hypothetical protein